MSYTGCRPGVLCVCTGIIGPILTLRSGTTDFFERRTRVTPGEKGPAFVTSMWGRFENSEVVSKEVS